MSMLGMAPYSGGGASYGLVEMGYFFGGSRGNIFGCRKPHAPSGWGAVALACRVRVTAGNGIGYD